MDTPLEIDVRAVKSKLDANEDFLFVDCREPDEHATANIAAAKLVPMSAITERLNELEMHRDKSIVIHCHHGGRSMRVTRWLRENGFDKAQSMAGGIDLWSQEIDPNVPRY
jgi:rhodanese-related sulfurtransferase